MTIANVAGDTYVGNDSNGLAAAGAPAIDAVQALRASAQVNSAAVEVLDAVSNAGRAIKALMEVVGAMTGGVLREGDAVRHAASAARAAMAQAFWELQAHAGEALAVIGEVAGGVAADRAHAAAPAAATTVAHAVTPPAAPAPAVAPVSADVAAVVGKVPAYVAAYKNPAKYMDPATGALWGGRGPVPKWMQAYLAAGATKDDFLIAKVMAGKQGAAGAQETAAGTMEAEVATGVATEDAAEVAAAPEVVAEVKAETASEAGAQSVAPEQERAEVASFGIDVDTSEAVVDMDSANGALGDLMSEGAAASEAGGEAKAPQADGAGPTLEEVLGVVDSQFDVGSAGDQPGESFEFEA